jgi:hypothetical protein
MLIAPDPAVLDDVYSRINQLRTKHHIAPLKRSAAPDAAAQNQAEWLATTGLRTHFRPDGSKPSTRAAQAGYNAHSCCGENYYLSIDATPDLVWNFWLRSHAHYENLINPHFDDVGLGMSSNRTRKSYLLVFSDAPEAPDSTPIPAGNTIHIVQPGETLFRIAIDYGTTVETLMQTNNINDPTSINAGQSLVIPQG